MEFLYETRSGVAGIIDASDQTAALQQLEDQYGAGCIEHLASEDQQAGAATNADPHGWARAFKAVAARRG